MSIRINSRGKVDFMRKEYGGYLPLEISEGEDWFSGCGGEPVLRTNSAKAAMYFAIRDLKARKIYAPYYMCRSVREMLRETGMEVEFYYLNEKLLPRLPHVEPEAAVLLVNYYGVMEEPVREEALGLCGSCAGVVIDQSHGFFARPVPGEGVTNIYSCRKFFGVPDGGYLVGKHSEISLEPETVSGHFSYLVTSSEQGTNAAYKEKQESDRYFYGNYKGMSRITRGMLSAVDYEGIRKKRRENLGCLHRLLGEKNRLEFSGTDAPAYLYPFLPKGPEGTGKRIKSALVAENIYVPTLWRELLTPELEGTLEYDLSENGVYLPVDQRYGPEDMEYLAGRVKSLLEGEEA